MNTQVHVLKSTCVHTQTEHMQLCKGLSGSICCICLHGFYTGFSVLSYAKQVWRKLKEYGSMELPLPTCCEPELLKVMVLQVISGISS